MNLRVLDAESAQQCKVPSLTATTNYGTTIVATTLGMTPSPQHSSTVTTLLRNDQFRTFGKH